MANYVCIYLVNSHKPLYRCIECIVVRLYKSVCMLLIVLHVEIRFTYTFLHTFLKSANEKNVYISSYVFQKLYWYRAIKLFECQKKKKYIWNTKYTIQHSIESSQTIKCIQYNIHDTVRVNCPNN